MQSILDVVRSVAVLLCAVAVPALSGCGGGGSSASHTQTFSLSATVSGLTNGGLALALNNAQVIVPSGVTTVMLASALSPGSAYTVVVATQPTGETCTVANGTGAIETTDVSNVGVSCSLNTYTIAGSITGLATSGLVLLDNGADAVTIAANSTQFTMNTKLSYGSSYAITVQTQPASQVLHR